MKPFHTISKFSIQMKRAICDRLNQVSKGWSKKTLRMYWLLFILIGMSISLEIFARAVLHSPSLVFDSGKPEMITTPHVIRLNEYGGDRKLIFKLQGYQHFLDSLATNDTIQYKKLIEKSPHLRDSLSTLIYLFSNHIK